MFWRRMDLFRFEYNVLGSNTIFSIRIQCFRFEYNVFGSNKLFSVRMHCFRFEYNFLGLNELLFYVNIVVTIWPTRARCKNFSFQNWGCARDVRDNEHGVVYKQLLFTK